MDQLEELREGEEEQYDKPLRIEVSWDNSRISLMQNMFQNNHLVKSMPSLAPNHLNPILTSSISPFKNIEESVRLHKKGIHNLITSTQQIFNNHDYNKLFTNAFQIYKNHSQGLSSIFQNINIINQSINWKEISESFSQVKKDILNFSLEMAKKEMYLNNEFLSANELKGYKKYLTEENLKTWMDEHLEFFFKKILQQPYLQNHARILSHSLEAFQEEKHEIAIIIILPAIEFFVSNWLVSQENGGVFDPNDPLKIKWDKKDLKKYGKYQLDRADDDLLEKVFTAVALQGVHKIFVYTSKSSIPRNSILHGSHDYSTLKRFDYVKLVYLFYALLPLYGQDFGKIK